MSTSIVQYYTLCAITHDPHYMTPFMDQFYENPEELFVIRDDGYHALEHVIGASEGSASEGSAAETYKKEGCQPILVFT